MSITEAENGAWACHVFLKADQAGKAESATANVTTLGNNLNHFIAITSPYN